MRDEAQELKRDFFMFGFFSHVNVLLILNKNSTIKTSSGGVVTIKNIRIVAKTNFVGFFSSIDNSNVSNLKFSNVTIDLDVRDGISYAGVLAGKINKSSISNISIENSTISSTKEYSNFEKLPYYDGGLVGGFTSSTTTIKNVTVSANINGTMRVAGGIAGVLANNVSVSSSYKL